MHVVCTICLSTQARVMNTGAVECPSCGKFFLAKGVTTMTFDKERDRSAVQQWISRENQAGEAPTVRVNWREDAVVRTR